jgi:hypothetical protein
MSNPRNDHFSESRVMAAISAILSNFRHACGLLPKTSRPQDLPPPSLQTRPTSDRLRETLFNIPRRGSMAPGFSICALKTGAVGIEALSRGATHVRRSVAGGTLTKRTRHPEVDESRIKIICAPRFREERSGQKVKRSTYCSSIRRTQ